MVRQTRDEPIAARERRSLRCCSAFAAVGFALSACTAAPSSPGNPPAVEIDPPSTVAASATTPLQIATAAPIATPIVARIYSKARFVWIHPAPAADGAWIGYLTLGGSVPLRGGSAELGKVGGGAGCDAWYAVEPRGFVCLGESTTLDPEDPVYASLARDAADVTSPWPYQYAESMGAPRYTHVPNEIEQRAGEWDLPRHLDHIRAAREADGADAIAKIDKFLIGVDLAPAGSAAPTLIDVGAAVREARPYVAPTSTIAYSRAFDVDGRAWLLTSDRAIVPKDRVRPYARSEYHGVELGHGVSLPLAFFRKQARPKYHHGEGDKLVPSGDSWPRLGWVAIVGDALTQDGKRFFATSEEGAFVLEADATIADRAVAIPFTTPLEGAPRTWLDISVTGGWLVAYEEREPIFATLVSPGRGGTPIPGIDPLKTASTPTGTFRIDGKFKTATMVSSTDDNIVHSDVEYVQNFHGPHALHGAYWHDGWGEPKSGGCVNLSPIDSKRLFDWTEPHVPEGWHGLRAIREAGRATTVVVHK